MTLLPGALLPKKAKVVRIAADGKVSDVVTGLTTLVGAAAGPDGSLYVSSLTAGFAENGPPAPGSVMRVLPGGKSEVVATDLPFPNGLVFDKAGNLYVATYTINPARNRWGWSCATTGSPRSRPHRRRRRLLRRRSRRRHRPGMAGRSPACRTPVPVVVPTPPCRSPGCSWPWRSAESLRAAASRAVRHATVNITTNDRAAGTMPAARSLCFPPIGRMRGWIMHGVDRYAALSSSQVITTLPVSPRSKAGKISGAASSGTRWVTIDSSGIWRSCTKRRVGS